jgi:hypothetical protein
MVYCPKWVFEAACGAGGADYLGGQLDLHTVANGYAATLSDFYSQVNAEEISVVVESLVRFLDELAAGETAAPLMTGFCYYKIMFEQANKPRKLKGLFGAADEPVKVREHSVDGTVKSFKAYVFALRNDVAEFAPPGWKLQDVEESEVIKKLADQSFSPLDFI